MKVHNPTNTATPETLYLWLPHPTTPTSSEPSMLLVLTLSTPSTLATLTAHQIHFPPSLFTPHLSNKEVDFIDTIHLMMNNEQETTLKIIVGVKGNDGKLYFECEIEENRIGGVRMIDGLGRGMLEEEIVILSASLNSMRNSMRNGSGAKLVDHRLSLYANINKNGTGKSALGLFKYEFSYSEDYSKDLSDPARKTALKLSESSPTSLLKKELTENTEATLRGIYYDHINGISAFGTQNEANLFIFNIAEEKDKLIYANTKVFKYHPTSQTLFIFRDNIEKEARTGSDLLVFTKESDNILHIDTNKLKIGNNTLFGRYIMNEHTVMKEELQIQIEPPSEILRSHFLPSTQAAPPLLIRSSLTPMTIQIPLSNDIVSGLYTSISLSQSTGSSKASLLTRTDMLLKVIVDSRVVSSEDIIVLEEHVLRWVEGRRLVVLFCVPVESAIVSMHCKSEEAVEVGVVDGKIVGTSQEENLLVVTSKAGKSYILHVIDLAAKKSKKIIVQSDKEITDFSIICFGTWIYYAYSTNTEVQIWSILTAQSPNNLDPTLVQTYSETSVPPLVCPRKINIRKDRNVKLAVYSECEPTKKLPDLEDPTFLLPILLDLDVTGGQFTSFRQTLPHLHDTGTLTLKALCGHQAAILSLSAHDLTLHDQSNEYFSSTLPLYGLGVSGVERLHCLEHGRVIVVGQGRGYILEIDRARSGRYRPLRLIRGVPADVEAIVSAEDEDSVVVNFIGGKGGNVARVIQLDAPDLFLMVNDSEKIGKLGIKFKNVQAEHIKPVVISFDTKIVTQVHEEPKVSLKNQQEKIDLSEGQLIKLDSHTGLETQGEIAKISINGAGISKLGLEIHQSLQKVETLVERAQTFAHSNGGSAWVSQAGQRSHLYYSYNGETPEENNEFKIGEHCVDSDMMHLAPEDWYIALACQSQHVTHITFIEPQEGHMRSAETSTYVTDPRVRIGGEGEVYLFGRLPHLDTLLGYHISKIRSIEDKFDLFLNDSQIHDYELLKVDNSILLIFSTSANYRLLARKIKSNSSGPLQTAIDLPYDEGLVHSFRCKEDVKTLNRFSCAFVHDGVVINLVEFEVKADDLGKIIIKEVKRRGLTVFGTMSGLKVDFDERLLAVSGGFFQNTTEVMDIEDLMTPGVFVYDLNHEKDFIAGHIGSSDLGFNPTAHNHDLRVIRKNGEHFLGIRGPSGAVNLYRLSSPSLSFGKIHPEALDDVTLTLHGITNFKIKLSTLFKASGTQEEPTTGVHKPDSSLVKPATRNNSTDSDLPPVDVSTELPATHHKKHHHTGLLTPSTLAIILSILGLIFLYYYCRGRGAQVPERRGYSVARVGDEGTELKSEDDKSA